MPQRPRLTVALTFDHDAISDSVRRGDPPVKVSHGEFGARVGVPRILELLAREGIAGDMVRAGPLARGVPGDARRRSSTAATSSASHGWYPRGLRRAPTDEQRDILGRSVEIVRRVDRRAAAGLSGAVLVARAATLELVEAAGYVYDSSLMADDHRPLSGPPRGSALGRRGHALGHRERDGRGAGLLGARRLADVRAGAGPRRPVRAIPRPRDLDRRAPLRPRPLAWRPVDRDDAPRMHRPRSSDGDARGVHRRGEVARRGRLRAARPLRRGLAGQRLVRRPAPVAVAGRASSIGGVSLPGERVLLARVVRADKRVRADRAPRRRGRTAAAAAASRARATPSARSTPSQPKAPSARNDAEVGQGARVSRTRYGRQRPAPRSSACWPAARSARPTRSARPSAPARRPAPRRVGWFANPARGAPRTGSRRTRSPVKTRPVRLPPCAAGARPTMSSRAAGSPKPGTGRAQYGLVAEARDLLARHLLAPGDQSRAARGSRRSRRSGGRGSRRRSARIPSYDTQAGTRQGSVRPAMTHPSVRASCISGVRSPGGRLTGTL